MKLLSLVYLIVLLQLSYSLLFFYKSSSDIFNLIKLVKNSHFLEASLLKVQANISRPRKKGSSPTSSRNQDLDDYHRSDSETNLLDKKDRTSESSSLLTS